MTERDCRLEKRPRERRQTLSWATVRCRQMQNDPRVAQDRRPADVSAPVCYTPGVPSGGVLCTHVAPGSPRYSCAGNTASHFACLTGLPVHIRTAHLIPHPSAVPEGCTPPRWNLDGAHAPSRALPPRSPLRGGGVRCHPVGACGCRCRLQARREGHLTTRSRAGRWARTPRASPVGRELAQEGSMKSYLGTTRCTLVGTTTVQVLGGASGIPSRWVQGRLIRGGMTYGGYPVWDTGGGGADWEGDDPPYLRPSTLRLYCQAGRLDVSEQDLRQLVSMRP